MASTLPKALLISGAVWLSACGSEPAGQAPRPVVDSGAGSDAGNVLADSGADASTDGSVGNTGYPPGPYGANVGETLPNLQLLGYLRQEPTGLASTAPLQNASLRDVQLSASVPYGVVHVSGFT